MTLDSRSRVRPGALPHHGSVTINLVCDEFAGEVTVSDTHMTALFVPGGVLVALDDPEP
ncbi:MAG: hypothetical protein IT177_12640 [Acidobacteria bacterium]|nr:hypothetical protein [Acidobacteriota bacterium]